MPALMYDCDKLYFRNKRLLFHSQVTIANKPCVTVQAVSFGFRHLLRKHVNTDNVTFKIKSFTFWPLTSA